MLRIGTNYHSRRDHTRANNNILQSLAQIALESVPERLAKACFYLSKTVEHAVGSGLPCNDFWMANIEHQLREILLL
jgi:hypothetical protein